MSLYRRGRIWWIELSSESGRVRESSRTADRKAAQEFHEKRKSEIWRSDKLGERVITWGEAVKTWMELKPRGLPDRYRLAKLAISPTESLGIVSSSIGMILAASSPSNSSFNRTLALIVAIFNASHCSPPSLGRRPAPPGRTRWLTAEEWGRLAKALDEESPLLRQAAEFTLATGLRENNVLELTWDQIDLARRVAWLHGDQMKARKALGVPLNDAACAILASRKGIDKKWVFGNPDYPLYKASNRAWYAAVRKAKLKGFRWHDLRHTWASWHAMNGTPLERLQKLGGWATAQMVQRYAHLSSEHLAEDAARVKPISLRYNAPKRASRRTVSPTKGR